MKIVTAVSENYSIKTNNSKKIFLAGGITNCPNWQADAIKYFERADKFDFTLFSPRRENFPINDPDAFEQQIVWEYNHLKESDIILFWFSKGSLNPIVLYELGKWGNSADIPIYIGVDSDYERKNDVVIQTKLSRPELKIYTNLEEMCTDIIKEQIFPEDYSNGKL